MQRGLFLAGPGQKVPSQESSVPTSRKLGASACLRNTPLRHPKGLSAEKKTPPALRPPPPPFWGPHPPGDRARAPPPLPSLRPRWRPQREA